MSIQDFSRSTSTIVKMRDQRLIGKKRQFQNVFKKAYYKVKNYKY